MNTPNETPENHQSKGKRPDRTQRAAFWLRTIELRKHKLTREYRKSLRDTAREGISDEEYAAMLGTLEKMARNLGWDESQKDERPFGRGFGRRHRHPATLHGFGPGHGFGHAHRDHHDHDGVHGHEPHHHEGPKRGFRRMRPTKNVATDTPQA